MERSKSGLLSRTSLRNAPKTLSGEKSDTGVELREAVVQLFLRVGELAAGKWVEALQLSLELRGVQIAAQEELRRDPAVQGFGDLEDDGLDTRLIALKLVLEERFELGRDPLADLLELALGFPPVQEILDSPFGDFEEVLAKDPRRFAKVGFEEDLSQPASELDDEDLGQSHSLGSQMHSLVAEHRPGSGPEGHGMGDRR